MPRVSLSEVEDAMLEHPDPVVTAPELADELPCSRRHVGDRLDLLERDGMVSSKKAGGRARVYWHHERVCGPRLSPEDHPDQSELEDVARPAGPPERDVDRETTDESDETDDDLLALDDDLAELDLPGEGDLADERREAVRACWHHLRREGTATRSDFVSAVYDDHPAGYGSEGGWWNAVGKQGLRGLADRRDDVTAPSEGAHQWRFSGFDEE